MGNQRAQVGGIYTYQLMVQLVSLPIECVLCYELRSPGPSNTAPNQCILFDFFFFTLGSHKKKT